MTNLAVALYARVSSDQQAQAQTIASQVAALRARVTGDGCVVLPECEFIDEGYSGATLVRPGLERLRDLSANGGIERLYVHSPDRLARKYAYQVLLLDEFQRLGIEVVFLNRELSHSPEDELLLQGQGMVAEYERAKILERSRRGKRHAAQVGSVNVLCGAPYGYRYVSKHEGGGTARYDILEEEARVVRQVFSWIGQERLSIGEVCRRLQRAEERTRTGRIQWDRSVVWGILKNPAYKGTAAFGKTRTGPLRPRLRAQRNGSLQPRRAVADYSVPREEWVLIPVPPLIEAALYEAVQDQLAENRRRARQSQRGARYLLQGLVAKCVGMPIMENRSVPVPANTVRVRMPIIDVWEPMAIGSVVSESVPIRRYGRILWSLRCGKKCVSCCKIPTDSSGNITGAVTLVPAVRNGRRQRVSAHRSPSSSGGWRA
jgi:site-specific DNA recombinase